MNASDPTVTPPPNTRRAAELVSAPDSPRARPDSTVAGNARRPSTLDRSAKTDLVVLAMVRAVMAVASLVIVYLSQDVPERYVALFYASLILYCLYSVWVAWALFRSGARMPHRALAWADVAMAGYLIMLTDGTNSVFFYFLFFAIISAAFTRGFAEGMCVTAAATVLYALSAVAVASFPSAIEFERMLIRPIWLLTFGFLASYWGGRGLEWKRRFGLLREIGTATQSRANVDKTIDAQLRRLCTFFGADEATLALRPGHTSHIDTGMIYAVSTAREGAGESPMPASDKALAMFLATPRRAVTWPRRIMLDRYVPLDTPSRMHEVQGSVQDVAALAHFLDAKFLVVCGYLQSDREGRLVLTRKSGPFREDDAAFLELCSRAVSSVVENATLTAELVMRATEFERHTISRDLHDMTIQPYIGLRMAIEGVAREFRDDPRMSERMAELVAMTDHGIRELRDYATRLRSGRSRASDSLAAAIVRHVRHLARFYGLNVAVNIDRAAPLDAHASDAVFRMVCEALSNVVRHSGAKRARVAIRSEGDGCIVEIANTLPPGSPAPGPFLPESIADRAAELGGHVAIVPAHKQETVVTVTIPRRLPVK